jgi:biofilm PGA synthesis N-glycosyltransferase PgaC
MISLRRGGYGFALLMSVVVVIVLGTTLYVALLREPFDIHDVVIRWSLVALLTFLGLLLVRYFLLLWFSFLNHLDAATEEGWQHEPLVSIVVPAFNEERTIDDVIRGLLALDYPRCEIIVVDDGSSDGTYRRALAAASPRDGITVRVVSQANKGKASAINRGIAVARADYVLCVDSDSVLTPGSLRYAMRHFHDPTVGAVAGNIKVGNRRTILAWLQALEYVEGLNMVRSAQAFFRTVNIVPGPLGVFRREAIVGAGWCPGETFAEDCDLTLALVARGWKVKYEPRAIAYTEAPERLQVLLKQRYRWTRGILQALRKHARPILFGGGRSNLGARVTVAYMIFEAVLWPVANVFANVFFLAVAMHYGVHRLLVLWWLQLTLLDMVGALFSVAMEREDFRLVPLAVVYRISYILLIDVAKCLATFEEMAGVSMSWGKLERVGRMQ